MDLANRFLSQSNHVVLCCTVISFSFLSLLYQKLTSDHPTYLIEQNRTKFNRNPIEHQSFYFRVYKTIGLLLSRSHLHGGNNSPQSAFYTDWLFSLSPVTAPEVFAKVNSTRPNWPLQKIPYIPYCSLFVPPKFCISIVFNFSWELKWPQEKHNAYVKFWEDKQRALWLPVDKMHKGRGQLTIIFIIF